MFVTFYGNQAVSRMRPFEYFYIFSEGSDDLENDRTGRWQVRRQLLGSTEYQHNHVIL